MSKKPSDNVGNKSNSQFDPSAIKPAIGMSEDTTADCQQVQQVTDDKDPINLALSLIQIYNAREKHLPSELDGLGERGWNILLELLVSDKRERPNSSASVFFTDDHTDPVFLRYIMILEKRGMISRRTGETKRLMEVLKLTDRGHLAVSKALWNISNEVG